MNIFVDAVKRGPARQIGLRAHLGHGPPLFNFNRVRPKFGFGFGYGTEADLTYGFGLVSATAKVQWHKFGFGRNITPKRRNRRK